jgi:MoaA/NifB/PqqE/SkfB family radical SAM enzyme
MMVEGLPSVILWEITYACPLRCAYCYSESGLRPSRQPPTADMLRIADALVRLGPRVVHISGGEPAIVSGLVEVGERLARGGVAVVLTTSGFGLSEEKAQGIARWFHSVHVSVDGPDAATHDRLRGRAGSFDAAIEALERFGELSRERQREGQPRVRFGTDCVVVRSNFDLIPRMVRELSPRFDEMEFMIFNGVVPQGLASRESYESELLDGLQTRRLNDEAFERELQQLVSNRVRVFTRDNVDLQMHPELVAEGTAWTLDRMIVEPDGLVRALEVYEGQVGNILTDAPELLWRRARERRIDPFVQAELATVKTAVDWAVATRRIDRRFASPDDLVRLDKRKPHLG